MIAPLAWLSMMMMAVSTLLSPANSPVALGAMMIPSVHLAMRPMMMATASLVPLFVRMPSMLSVMTAPTHIHIPSTKSLAPIGASFAPIGAPFTSTLPRCFVTTTSSATLIRFRVVLITPFASTIFVAAASLIIPFASIIFGGGMMTTVAAPRMLRVAAPFPLPTLGRCCRCR